MNDLMRTLPVLAVLLVVALPLSTWAADPHVLTYSVSGQVVTVVSAVTPYDSNPKVRNAFLHWFKLGLETILAGHQPLMIEWDITPEAKAGQRGYDFGMDEAERYLKKEKEPKPSLQTTSIPPL